jgi:hypothetical protein
MATIKPRRGTGAPSGLAQNELAIDPTNKRVYLGNVGGTGDIVASHITDYVASLNGSTGAVANVARTNEGNTFSVQQILNSGLSVSATTNTLNVTATSDGIGLVIAQDSGTGVANSRIGKIKLGRSSTSGQNHIIENNTGKFGIYTGNLTLSNAAFATDSTGITLNAPVVRVSSTVSIPEFPVSGNIRIIVDDGFSLFTNADLMANTAQTASTTHTLPLTTGTLLNTTSSYVSGICGATGAITLLAGSGIGITKSASSFSISNTGVQSINGSTGAVGISAGSNITISFSGNTYTIASTASGSGSGFTYAASAPGSPSVGDRWMDSDNGKEYVYINDGSSSQWIEPVSSNGLTGITYDSSTNTIQFNSKITSPNLMSIVFTPLDNQPPASNYATIDSRNGLMVLEFDAATDESAVFVGIMPQTSSLSSGLKIRINWIADTATSGTCRWGAQIERMNTDLDSDSFDTASTAGSTTNGTSGIITTTEITITTIDSLAVGEPFRLKVYRDADGTSGTDDMTGDAQLISVEIRSGA